MMTTEVERRGSPSDVRTRRWAPRLSFGLGASLGLLLLFTRLRGLGHSLWWDEAYTAWAYVRRAGAIRSPDHYLGNNHVLFSFLTNRTTELVGTVAEPVLRFWSVFPGLLATAVLILWLWRRSGPALALTTLGFLYLSVEHARHIPEARGYGLVLLGSVALVGAGSAASRRDGNWVHDATFVTGGAIGVAAIPTLAFAAVPQGLAVMLVRKVAWLRLLLLGVGSAAILAWWYWPLREPMLHYSTSVGSRSGVEVTWANFLLVPLRHLGTGPSQALLSPLPHPLIMASVVALAVLGGWALLQRDRALGLQVSTGVIGGMAIVGILGVHAPPRYVLFLLPHVAVAIAAGLVRLGEIVIQRIPPRVGIPLLGVTIAIALVRGSLPVLEEHDQPRQAFAESLRVIAEADVETIYSDRLHIGYRWYLGEGVDEVIVIADADELQEAVCSSDRPAAYLPYPRAHTHPDPLPCFDEPGWAVYDPPSLHPTTVWLRAGHAEDDEAPGH